MRNRNSTKRADGQLTSGHADTQAPVLDAEQTMMRLLEDLDRLKVSALNAGDTILHDQLDAAFQSCLTRYCDSKHAELERRMRQSLNRPKAFMN